MLSASTSCLLRSLQLTAICIQLNEKTCVHVLVPTTLGRASARKAVAWEMQLICTGCLYPGTWTRMIWEKFFGIPILHANA